MERLIGYCGWSFILALAGTGLSLADDQFTATTSSKNWLQPQQQQEQAQYYGSFTTASGQDLQDPFSVLASGSLWQDKESVTYSRAMADHLTLNCTSSSVSRDGAPDQLGNDVRAESVYQPFDAVKITGNVHDSQSDSSPTPATTSGAGCSVETHLPLDTTFTAAMNSDQTHTDSNPGLDATTNAYDASVQKPLGKLPLSLLLKGHLVESTASPGASATRLPSFEQSLVWKPLAQTTVQAGLRQQQYQNFPGIDSQLNEALFADWSQRIIDDKITWHSYAEMMNTRSTVQIAEVGLGANGTAQPDVPQGGATVSSALPVTTTDEKLTLSTGPSLQLQKDVSASIQYSDSWDQKPAAGAVGQEQRVSVSLKGTF